MPSDYQEICNDNIRRRGEEFDDIGRLISEQLYSDRSHFIYELLQNAEDALERRFRLNPNDKLPLPCKVQFRLFQDRLEFRHFGEQFDEEDVRGICDVLKGTKKEDFIQIGKFGIGFKSVYAFTASPEIHSGDEHFVIKRYIRPEAKDPDCLIADRETVFNFPFDHEELTANDAFYLILKKLRGLGPRTLLFLRRIDEIEWGVEPGGEKGQYLKEANKIENYENVRRITLIGQSNGLDEEVNWLIFEKALPVPNGSCQVSVEIGFHLWTHPNDHKERIIRINDAPLVVYFPTEKATRFGFLINGPYRTTPSRDNVPPQDDWNKFLVIETAHLLTQVLPLLREMGLLTISLLETLPIMETDLSKDSMFFPIVAAVREAFMFQDLLPADDGTFVSWRNAKLASAEWLRKLLREEQLRQLLKTSETLKWISGEITERAKHDLWRYIRVVLEVEEITPDSFARRITQSFLETQTDDWFVEFYCCLSDQKALWRPPRWPGDTDLGILRAKPILRLEDDSLKVPFQSNGTTPNAFMPPQEETDFPIVKRTVVRNEQVVDFLKRLGLSQPDIFDDIVRKILPKYNRAEALSIPEQEYTVDIQKILRALKSSSDTGKKRVIEAARSSTFVRAIDQSGRVSWKRPGEVYVNTPDLWLYFSSPAVAWFLDEQQLSLATDVWGELGISHLPRRLSCSDGLPPEEAEYSTRGVTVENYDLHGLESFLLSLQNVMDFDQKKKTSLVLWRYLKEHLKLDSLFLKGRYQWFYYSWHSKRFDSLILARLRNTKWISTKSATLERPGDLTTGQLLDECLDAKELILALGIQHGDSHAILSEEQKRHVYATALGVTLEDVEFLKKHSEEFEQLKNTIAARNEKPIFPTRLVTNPERRQERLTEQLTDTPEKVYEERERSVRITGRLIDQTLWLRNQYTNDIGQIVCQICEEEMPFKKRDGEYYFEAVEALSKEYFGKEHEAQFLALCPLCAAMYKEFVKLDESAMKELAQSLRTSEKPRVALKLGKIETSVQFVESHWHDIKTILEETGQ
jgi:hypothetical protein